MNNLHTYTPATYLPNYSLHCKKTCKEKCKLAPSLYNNTVPYGNLCTSTGAMCQSILRRYIYGGNCNFV